MLSSSIRLKSFKINRIKDKKKIQKKLRDIFNEKNQIIKSLGKSYIDKYKIKNLKKNKYYRLIGMGGSILGTQAIYCFLRDRIKKNFLFIDNLIPFQKINKKEKYTNLIISKSGNTLETISNANILINKKDENIFITENKPSYLLKLASKLKSEVIYHNNFIGGRYSVLSEVGMLPAELMGLNAKKFRQFDNLIKNKKFFFSLVHNTSAILYFAKKRYNSIIINYDEKSNYLFQWYQQLVAESLGKKGKGILPIISTMPKDNHSVMQFYLDGIKNNFYTFFFCKEKISNYLNKKDLLPSFKYLSSHSMNDIIFKQKIATENIFSKKKIPFRSFEIDKRSEKCLGELFCYFILETILLGKLLNVNPYDQPSVELIKTETKKQFKV